MKTSVQCELLTLFRLFCCPRIALIAENLFLRKQFALFKEREAKPPRRTTPSARPAMIAPGKLFDWRTALVIVKPATFINWHRTMFLAFWRWRSRKPGRPAFPRNLRELVREIARQNPTWSEERIANELKLKLGVKISPRTVGKYLQDHRPSGARKDQRWSTFVRNHAKAVVACDFFVSVTATFQAVYVFVAMEVGSRRMLPCNATQHPTSEWTTQQLREILAGPHPYRFVIHDRDCIFSLTLDLALKDFGVRVLKTTIRVPQANAFGERLIGTIRRECLDYLIPVNERHLLRIQHEFICYYHRGRPHSSLGTGIPEPLQPSVLASGHRHRLPAGFRVTKTSVLAGLHHDYRLEKAA